MGFSFRDEVAKFTLISTFRIVVGVKLTHSQAGRLVPLVRSLSRGSCCQPIYLPLLGYSRGLRARSIMLKLVNERIRYYQKRVCNFLEGEEGDVEVELHGVFAKCESVLENAVIAAYIAREERSTA